MSRYIYNEKLKHRRGKSQLREASEHNLASFRARGNKWLDPGKDSLTDEMLNFIYSRQRKLACREIRTKLYEKYFNDAFQHYGLFNTWDHLTDGCLIHGSWVQAEIRRHAKADRKTAEAAKVQVKKAETKSLINYYGVNQKPLQPRPLGEADFFIAAPIPATRTDEAEGDEKWRMPKDSKPAGKILGTGLGKGASRGKIKIVNGIRLKKDGTPYKKMGRKPNHSRTTKPNNSSSTSTGEIVEVKVEEITNDDVPLDCLPMEEDEPEEENKEEQSVEAATTVKVEDIIEETPQSLLQPVPPPPSTMMDNVVQVQLLPKLVAIQPRVQQKAADVDLQNALQHQIALLTKENTKLTCNNLSLQEDLGKMIKFVYQNKGSVNCILCRGEKMKSETYSREQLNSHLAECHSEKETSSLEVSFNHIKKTFEYHVFHHC